MLVSRLSICMVMFCVYIVLDVVVGSRYNKADTAMPTDDDDYNNHHNGCGRGCGQPGAGSPRTDPFSSDAFYFTYFFCSCVRQRRIQNRRSWVLKCETEYEFVCHNVGEKGNDLSYEI